MTDLTITDLTSPADDPALVARTYDEVLRPSFTTDELAGPDAVTPGDGRVLTVAVAAGGLPVAAAVTETVPDGVSLLAYLAVSPAARGLGAGGRMVDHLQESWRALGLPLVVGEVHDPRGHAESEDEHPEARLRFYGRAGARVLDVPWVQPALDAGGARVPHMLLLAMHETDAPDVASADVLDWARDYFSSAEGEGYEDAQVAALLARIGARERIAVLPLEQWRQVEPLE